MATKRGGQVLLFGMLLSALFVVWALTATLAHADTATQPEGPHQVLVCKYVGTPGDGEVLQTGQNPIVVDTSSLEGDGFAGTFPFEFSDAQGRSVAIRYLADGESPGDQFSITECEGGSPSPTPTPTPSPSPSESPTPSPTTPPTTTPPPSSGTSTPPPVSSGTHTPSSPTPSVRPTAFTGSRAELLGGLAALLLLTGLVALRLGTTKRTARR